MTDDDRQALALIHQHRLCCPDCEYNLRELPEPRCPECGRTFTLGHVQGYIRLAELEASGRGPPSPAAVMNLLAGFLLVLSAAPQPRTGSRHGPNAAGPLVGLILIASVVWYHFYRRRHGVTNPRRVRIAAYALWGLLVLGLVALAA